MKEIFVLVEHRQGVIRDITWEMLSRGRELATNLGVELSALLLGYQTGSFAQDLAKKANRVLVVEDQRLENFNVEAYQKILSRLITTRTPVLTLIGHTGFGLDLAPSLAAELDLPLSTDCVDVQIKESQLSVIRQMYGGKIAAEVSFLQTQSSIITIRPGSFKVVEQESSEGEIETIDSPLSEDIDYKRFLEYVQAPVGEVDITQAEIIVAVGQGIKDVENLPVVEELAEVLGGTLACSRPVVDKKWLPKDRQVGTSGKTVSPKVYIAIGISGAFQHIAGMKGSGIIIAINKDPKAPIFGAADYGIVDDLFKVVPILKKKIAELKAVSKK